LNRAELLRRRALTTEQPVLLREDSALFRQLLLALPDCLFAGVEGDRACGVVAA
jgi:hypothetical protein